MNWYSFLKVMLFPLSFLPDVYSIFSKYKKKVRVKERIVDTYQKWFVEGQVYVLKEHPSLNRFQNRYLTGRPLWKEWVLNSFYKYWFPLRVRLESYTYPISYPLYWLGRLIFNWVKAKKNWIWYESKVLYYQWGPLKKNRGLVLFFLKSLVYLAVGSSFLYFWYFFFYYIYPFIDDVILIFLTEPVWVQIKGYLYVFSPACLFGFLWIHKVLLTFWFESNYSEDLSEKFRKFDLFDEFDGNSFYQKVQKIAQKGEEKNDDTFMYEGGLFLSDWEKKDLSQETECMPKEGWGAEILYKRKGDLVDIPPLSLNQKGLNLEDLPKETWKKLFEKGGKNPYEVSSFLSSVFKESRTAWVDPMAMAPLIELPAGNWDDWQINEDISQGDLTDEDEEGEYFKWEPEMEFIGGGESDLELDRDRDVNGHFQDYLDLHSIWIDFSVSLSPLPTFVNSYYSRENLFFEFSRDSDEKINFYSMYWFSWDWYDYYNIELNQADQARSYRPSRGKMVELEWKSFSSSSWLPWDQFTKSDDRWFDDPFELGWKERFFLDQDLFEDETEEEGLDEVSESTPDLDEGVYDLAFKEAERVADYMVFSVVVIIYLFWDDLVSLDHPTDPRIPPSKSKWIRPIKIETEYYTAVLTDKRKEYIDPKLKKPIQKGKKWIRETLGLKWDPDEYFKYAIPAYFYKKTERFLNYIKKPVYSWFKQGMALLAEWTGMEIKDPVGREGENWEWHKKKIETPHEYKRPHVVKRKMGVRSKWVRQVVFTRKYIKKRLAKEEDEEGTRMTVFTICLPNYDPELYFTKEMSDREHVYSLLNQGETMHLDFFKENYQMEAYQIKEGAWSIIDYSYTWWGSFFRMFRFVFVLLSSFFWYLVEGSIWTSELLFHWYLFFWWPLWFKVFSFLLWPISRMVEIYVFFFSLTQELWKGYVSHGPGWLFDISDQFWRFSYPFQVELLSPDWVKKYFYSYTWWDSISFPIPYVFPKHNLILFRIWWETLPSNFFLVVIGNWMVFFVKLFFLGMQSLIDLLGITWNLNLWMFAQFLNVWVFCFHYLLMVYFWFIFFFLWLLIKLFLWVC